MDTSQIIAFISSAALLGSMILNWVQYRSGKKGTELSNIDKQLEILEKLQAEKDKNYQYALKNKELEIEQLKKDVADLTSKLEANTQKLTLLQNAVSRLIGDGCKHAASCTSRLGYDIDELGAILNPISEDK